jgi:hypothetical protein
MYTLSNDHLDILILDPILDIYHLGSRYCTGGYIWQIRNRNRQDLLSGPHFPSDYPLPFDGQGAPEVFESAPDADAASCGELVLVPGVGLVRKSSIGTPFHVRNNPEVVEFCKWDIHKDDTSLVMITTQVYQRFEATITRSVSLHNTTVTSKTEVSYQGKVPFELRWFAHPFFPLNNDLRCCELGTPLGLIDNHAFRLDDDHVLSIKHSIDRSISSYTLLTTLQEKPFHIRQIHPVTGAITVTTDFIPSKIPVWTNERTFSIEPYFSTALMPQQCVSWAISYTF